MAKKQSNLKTFACKLWNLIFRYFQNIVENYHSDESIAFAVLKQKDCNHIVAADIETAVKGTLDLKRCNIQPPRTRIPNLHYSVSKTIHRDCSNSTVLLQN